MMDPHTKSFLDRTYPDQSGWIAKNKPAPAAAVSNDSFTRNYLAREFKDHAAWQEAHGKKPAQDAGNTDDTKTGDDDNG